MGALPLGERRRRIRPAARGDQAHSRRWGELRGVRGVGSGARPGVGEGGCPHSSPPHIPAAIGAGVGE